MEKTQIRSKLPLGIALLVIGLLLFNQSLTQQKKTEQQTFTDEPVLVKGFIGNTGSESEKLPIRIVITSISVDLPVRKAEIVNGYWEVFKDSAGWGDSTGIPGEIGNQVIFAHARENLFLHLREIAKDDEILVFTKQNKYIYKVAELKEVAPDKTEVVAPTPDETLTLYTCSGYKDSRRFIVTAKRKV